VRAQAATASIRRAPHASLARPWPASPEPAVSSAVIPYGARNAPTEPPGTDPGESIDRGPAQRLLPSDSPRRNLASSATCPRPGRNSTKEADMRHTRMPAPGSLLAVLAVTLAA